MPNKIHRQVTEKRLFSIEHPPPGLLPQDAGAYKPGECTSISSCPATGILFLLTMNLKERYPAFGGRGPGDMSVGIALGVVATIFIALRIYVRLRINTFGTSALIWALFAWVRERPFLPSYYISVRIILIYILTRRQTCTVVTQICGIIAALHGLGNHMTVIMAKGNLQTYLLFTWITVFFFNLAIPAGKVAVSAYLIELNGQGSQSLFPCTFLLYIYIYKF